MDVTSNNFLALLHASSKDFAGLIHNLELTDFPEDIPLLWGDGGNKLVGLDRPIPNLDRQQIVGDGSAPLFRKERLELPRPIEDSSNTVRYNFRLLY
jgi:hypothetical protein